MRTPNSYFDEHDHQIAVDDTNYLAKENGGCLRPGCMLECRGKVVDGEIVRACTSTAGLLVQKGADKRLTVAAHGWETKRVPCITAKRSLAALRKSLARTLEC